MDKVPIYNLWGILFIIGLLVFLIWLGPIEHQKQLKLDEIIVDGVNCNRPLTDLNDTQIEICLEIRNSTRS